MRRSAATAFFVNVVLDFTEKLPVLRSESFDVDLSIRFHRDGGTAVRPWKVAIGQCDKFNLNRTFFKKLLNINT